MSPNSRPRILASMRSADPDRWEQEVAALAEAGVDGLHLDVMDGRFVAETAFEAADVTRLRECGAGLVDVHLLVEEPAAWVDAFLDAGCDRLSFHLECVDDPSPLLSRIRSAGARAGLVLLPGTPLAELDPWLDAVDLVNPLGVDPTKGLGFQEVTFERIAQLAARRGTEGLDFVIQGDGGVWEKTRDGFVQAGADELVGGYPIFSAENYTEAVAALREGNDSPKE